MGSQLDPKQLLSAMEFGYPQYFGLAVVYGLRVNLSVAMVAMVNNTYPQPSLNHTIGQECPAPIPSIDNSTQTPDQPDGVRNSHTYLYLYKQDLPYKNTLTLPVTYSENIFIYTCIQWGK